MHTNYTAGEWSASLKHELRKLGIRITAWHRFNLIDIAASAPHAHARAPVVTRAPRLVDERAA